MRGFPIWHNSQILTPALLRVTRSLRTVAQIVKVPLTREKTMRFVAISLAVLYLLLYAAPTTAQETTG